ncbi:MAG TPA: zinc ribbon domain-containing protein [Candidatus Melainabacteria bacterium]|nr:zinc ribbon domain-containing protein [Candidatus Melainabacteria bacterium]HIN66655.1 zinc ribbon domain-containing protein [Candidatus Obscuribacterales bacterium]
MIECPICHVMNEDGAHFCAECGQRFTPAGPPQPPALGSVQPGFSQPPGPPQTFNPPQSPNPADNHWNQMPNNYPPDQPNQPNQGNTGGHPEQPKKRLHSPILGGGYEDEPEPEPEVKRGRSSMRGGGPESGGKPKHLRSPLLGGADDDDDDDYEEPRRTPNARPGKPGTKGGLRSPLLGGADDDDDYDEPQSRGGFPRRSRDMQDDEPHERGSGRGLRSPLLGGGSDDDDSAFSSLRRTNKPTGNFPNDRRSKPDVWDPGSEGGSGKRPRLRSSLLGGGSADDYDDYEDEDEEIADPKALRSPLLRAVTSPHDQVPPAKPQQQHQPPAPQPQAPQQYQQGPEPGYGQQDPGSPLFRQPLTPPQPNSNYADPQQMMQPQMPQPSQQSYAPPQPPPPPPPPQPALQQAASPFARNSEPDPASSRLSTSNMPTTVKPSKPARFQPDDSDVPSRPSFDKFASDAPERGAGGGGSVSPAIAGLCALAIILKGWYFFSYPTMWNQAPFVADQFAEILVMVALIIVVMGVSKGRS